jgi:hypothetical protein
MFKNLFIWVHTEALVVMADFVFNSWALEILPYNHIRHIWCVPYHGQSLRLEAFRYFYVERGCGSAELYSVGPDWFEEFVFIESFDLRMKMCLCQVSLLSRCSSRYLTSSV